MRRIVPATLVTVVAVSGAALPATASTPPAAQPRSAAAPAAHPAAVAVASAARARTAVTLAVSPGRVRTGAPLTLVGAAQLVRAGGRLVALKGARLTLQYRTAGAARWTAVRTVTTSTGGYRIVWRYPLRQSSTVRAVLAAGTTTAAAVSPSRTVVRVAPLPAPRAYRLCTDVNRVYPHGVGLPGARDRTSRTPVTTFTRDAATYRLNTARDGDKDGIACEKR